MNLFKNKCLFLCEYLFHGQIPSATMAFEILLKYCALSLVCCDRKLSHLPVSFQKHKMDLIFTIPPKICIVFIAG